MSLLLNWRLWACLLLVLGGGWAGWTLKPVPPAAPPVVVDRVQTEERVVTRVVTVEKRPDGTTVERTEEKDESSASKSAVAKPVPAPPKPKWSVEAAARLQRDLGKPDWQAILYRRVSDTNAWVGAGYDFTDRAMLLGVRIDF